MAFVRLKPSRDKALLRRHPWIFSGAVKQVQGDPGRGDCVRVLSAQGEFLAWGAYSPDSMIRVRIWSWDEGEVAGEAFFRSRLKTAIKARQDLVSPQETNALRLVHGESDGLPGLVVDRYVDTLVVQFLSSGAERWRDLLLELLLELTSAERVYERSDVDVRRLEGLAERSGPLRGAFPSSRLQISENGLRFWVDLEQGHKTGYYLDQRANRACVRELARDLHVLDCFSYTGGFSLHALAGGAASVVAVDSSSRALEVGRQNLALNELPATRMDWLEGDVFQVLRSFRDRARRFDMIILDPPKFAPTATQAQRAARAYKDINLLALKLLREGGLLVTFSCSGGVDAGLFQKIVAGAALDAGVEAQIVARLGQGVDHPVALNFPEGTYLKGLIIRVNG